MHPMEKVLREMEAKLVLQENTVKEVLERCVVIETAILRIGEYVQRQNVFNESTRASVAGLVEEVGTTNGPLLRWRECSRATNSTL